MFTTVFLVTSSLVGFSAPARPVEANLRTAASLLLQASPVMLLLFVLFPRVQGPLWGMPQDAYSGVTGLSDSMSPGSLSRLSTSDAIAFRVKFAGDPPPRGQLYWRGPVFWDFDGRTWRPGGGRLRPQFQFQALGTPVDYEVTLEPHNLFWLFGLDLPSRAPPNARVTSDYQMFSVLPVRSRVRYDLRSYPNYVATDGNGIEEMQSATRLPRNVNPRARALAQEWRRTLGNDEAILRQAIEFLRAGGFEYTLQPPLLQENTVDEFLFETKKGFCEHFASSFTFLMRAAGVPARVVTGYQGGDPNPVDEYLVVRQADAHAWSEVWLAGRGWTRVDPTAVVVPLRVESGLAASVPQDSVPYLMRQDLTWLRNMRYNWDALANKWNQWVLGYNPDRQRDMLNRLGVNQPSWQLLAQILFWSVAAVIGLTAGWLLWRVRRKDPVQAAWLAFCAKLGRKGLARGASEGPLDYARRIEQALPEKTGDVREISGLYTALRYGREHPPGDVARLRRQVSAFRA
jgi:transglutaminase-like putative cysteine protease